MPDLSSQCECHGYHVWDEESDAFATYTPDPDLDEPMVIHECIEPGCRALKIERHLFSQGRTTLIYEVAEGRPSGPCPSCGGPHDSPCLALPPEHRAVSL